RTSLTPSISWISSGKSSMPPKSPTVAPSWWAVIDFPGSRISSITTQEKDLWSRLKGFPSGWSGRPSQSLFVSLSRRVFDEGSHFQVFDAWLDAVEFGDALNHLWRVKLPCRIF